MEKITITIIENPQGIDIKKIDFIKTLKSRMLDLGLFVTVEITKD